jgi:hypothetical protein
MDTSVIAASSKKEWSAHTLACLMNDKILVFLLEQEKISLFLLAKFGQKRAKLRIQNWKINRFWRSSIARSKPHNK